MAARARSRSPLVRPLVVLALPGMYLLYKYNQYRQQQMESARRRVTERELLHLNTKIDKLLNKLDESEPELATTQEDECVICVNAKATMETSPCGHRVVCRRCFVKTIQMAVSQRLLPLRCVICRAKILRLRHTPQPRAPLAPARLVSSKSWQATPPSRTGGSGATAGARVPGSVSCYSVGARSVPASASLYSVTSGESSLSGVSSVSSASGVSGVTGAACSGKLCAGARCGGVCLGAVPRAPAPPPTHPRQPASGALRRSQHHSMKLRLQEYATLGSYTSTGSGVGGSEGSVVGGGGRLPPIREFQREFREGRRTTSGVLQGPTSAPSVMPTPHTAAAAAPLSVSTRIRCAQKIVTQLEISPQKRAQNLFRTPLRAHNEKAETQRVRTCESSRQSETKIEAKLAKDDKKKKEAEGSKKRDESAENGKNEAAERKREEKARLKAEKEARSQAKRETKEAERLAKQKAKEEERQAKALAKEEKKKAKREAKLAAQTEKERAKNATD